MMTENLPEEDLTSKTNTELAIKKIAYPDIKATVSLFFTFILNSFIVIIPAVIIAVGMPYYVKVYKHLFEALLYGAIMLATIYSALKKSKKQQGYPSKISFNRIPWWLIPVIIFGTAGLIMPFEALSSIIPMPASTRNFFEQQFTTDVFSIVTAVLLAPIFEEILCREIVLKGLLKNYPPNKAIFISASFFAILHLNPWQGIPAFFGALFMGWVYYKTKSVVTTIIIHATMNGISTVLLFLPTNKDHLIEVLGIPYYFIGLMASVVVFAIACRIIQKKIAVVPNILS